MKLQKLAEENVVVLIIFTFLVISIGLFIEVIPQMFSKTATEPAPGVKPYTAIQVAGRDIYVREGCYNCHSQMIRPFRAETERYGHYSVGGESVYDHPFQWGSKRTGPDLARVGGRYSDEWHRIHLLNPRDVVPESNMPAFPWLAKAAVDGDEVTGHMKTLRTLGTPYTDDEIAQAKADVEGYSELDALIAYLQGLGLALKNVR
ncbi:MAG: cytochrome-c oxidase, cbb3-type subunit II [Neisseriaceae bacterium]|nr:cytochrome-c oxidase, cbb3-type subunit II [Neisseriaceae bacterium]MBP6863482.1 cytochrome-c oxidase, cbb3-type subunit II [Neisseriaceae bacterium]